MDWFKSEIESIKKNWVQLVLIILLAGSFIINSEAIKKAQLYEMHQGQIDAIHAGNATVYWNINCPKNFRQDLVCSGFTYAPDVIPNTTRGIG